MTTDSQPCVMCGGKRIIFTGVGEGTRSHWCWACQPMLARGVAA